VSDSPPVHAPKRLRLHWSWNALSLGSLVGIALLVYFMWRLREVLLVLIASIFMAYVLEPPVALLARCPVGRNRCVGRKAAAAIAGASDRSVRLQPDHVGTMAAEEGR